METTVYTKKDQARSYFILFFLVTVLTLISTGIKIQTMSKNGLFHLGPDQATVITFAEGQPDTMYTVSTTNSQADRYILHNIRYTPRDGQWVFMFRFHMETKTKSWPQVSWIVPKVLVLSSANGEFGLVANDAGDGNMGFVRNNPIFRYIVPVNNTTHHYRTLSLGILPENGDIIRFWYIGIFPSQDKFLNLTILY